MTGWGFVICNGQSVSIVFQAVRDFCFCFVCFINEIVSNSAALLSWRLLSRPWYWTFPAVHTKDEFVGTFPEEFVLLDGFTAVFAFYFQRKFDLHVLEYFIGVNSVSLEELLSRRRIQLPVKPFLVFDGCDCVSECLFIKVWNPENFLFDLLICDAWHDDVLHHFVCVIYRMAALVSVCLECTGFGFPFSLSHQLIWRVGCGLDEVLGSLFCTQFQFRRQQVSWTQK